MELILQQMPIVVHSLNIGFLQTLRLFLVTLIGAFPLGLIIAFGSMSQFKPLSYFIIAGEFGRDCHTNGSGNTLSKRTG